MGEPPCQVSNSQAEAETAEAELQVIGVCILPHLRSWGGYYFQLYSPHPSCLSKVAVEVGGGGGEIYEFSHRLCHLPVQALRGTGPSRFAIGCLSLASSLLPLVLRLMGVGSQDCSRHCWAPNHMGAELEERV